METSFRHSELVSEAREMNSARKGEGVGGALFWFKQV